MLTPMIAPFGTKRANFGHSDKKVSICNCLYVSTQEPASPDARGYARHGTLTAGSRVRAAVSIGRTTCEAPGTPGSSSSAKWS